MATHTRTHVHVTFANPYLCCDQCDGWLTGWHDDDRCGCDAGCWNQPCEHRAGMYSACPTWNPVDGCECLKYFDRIPHAEPVGRDNTN